MNKILIVDGSNLLFQMFYGMPARIIGKQGRPIHGTVGFMGALLKMIRMTNPTHIAVLFDGETHNPRKDIDESYKANRPDFSEMEEDELPFSQLPDIYAALDHLQICHKETTDCETDDWVASYALNYGTENEMVIASFDSDFFQLITDKVNVLRYRGDKSVICTPEYIKEKLDIAPNQYADFKSLVGDTADNIKGADKVGPKTAAQLLAEYHGLESIILNAESIKKPSVKQSICQSADRLRKNYSLIKLRGDTPLPFELREMKHEKISAKSTEVLRDIGVI